MRVELSIDELVLDGADPRDRHRIADALASALEARVDGTTAAALIAPGGPRDSIVAPTPVQGRPAATGSSAGIERGGIFDAAAVADSILRGIARPAPGISGRARHGGER